MMHTARCDRVLADCVAAAQFTMQAVLLSTFMQAVIVSASIVITVAGMCD